MSASVLRKHRRLGFGHSGRILFTVVFTVATGIATARQTSAPATATNVVAGTSSDNSTNIAPSKIFDAEDGWLDVSGFLDEAYGFVPMVMPITEPAIGYGGGLGLIFIDRNEPYQGETFRKPNIGGVGGLATENGTWAVFGAHSGSWLDGDLETLIGAAYGSINLDFYGIGDGPLNNHPFSYNIKPLGGLFEGRYRLGSSPIRAGLRYGFGQIDASFDNGTVPAQVRARELDSTVSGFTPTLTYDTRNNTFTPTRGVYAQAGVNLNRHAFGSDFNFEIVDLMLLYYIPIAPKLSLGLRTDASLSFDDVPFYLRPYINLRGVAAMRYVGEHMAEMELEARWQFWRRFSLVGFVGTGVAWNDLDRFDNRQNVVTGGVGFRYELARKYGLHMGIDVAFGPDQPAIYIQFGSAWFRP